MRQICDDRPEGGLRSQPPKRLGRLLFTVHLCGRQINRGLLWYAALRARLQWQNTCGNREAGRLVTQNRQLTGDELMLARRLLEETRERLISASGGDSRLLWAMRRKIAKELVYDDRGTPMERRRLKVGLERQSGVDYLPRRVENRARRAPASRAQPATSASHVLPCRVGREPALSLSKGPCPCAPAP